MHSARRRLIAVVAALAVWGSTPWAVPAGFVNEIWIGGLNEPTVVTFLPDGRFVVAERGGRIRIAPPGGNQLLTAPLLTITNIDVTGGERGLVGITAHPQFASNPYLYVFYTAAAPLRDRVSRFTVSGDTALLASELVVWQDTVIPDLYHHGGTVAFGPDGLLYISTGDHFNPLDAQSLASYHGKILRIGPDGIIPADNPFHDGAGPNLDAIWARGLRNPFRFSFDRLTGTMYIGDVGSNEPATSIEEVNVGAAGANFGWPLCEGSCTTAGMTGPVFSYAHANRDASITGGFVYRGTVFPVQYQGSYFFGDYAQNWIRRLTFSAPGVVTGVVNFEPTSNATDGPYGEIVDVKEGPDGALYYADIGPFGATAAGSVRRIRYTLANAPPIAVATANPATGPAPLLVSFSSSGSYDPEGSPMTYAWDFGDGQASIEANPTHVYATNGAYTVRLTVSDGDQQTVSAPLAIRVGRPPVVTLTLPASGVTFRAGDTIPVAGSALDPDEGALPPASLSWTVVFHHDTHQHPFLGPTTGGTGSFVVPSSGHDFSGDTRYEVIVTAIDSDGLSTSASAFVWPQKAAVAVDSAPTGLDLSVDGVLRRAPFVLDSLIGFQHLVAASSPQLLGGSTYSFVSWSDGGAAAHTATTPPASSTLIASYQVITGPVTATYSVINPVDDANEVTTTFDNVASTVWVGTGGSATASYTGLRFPLDIPRGSTISSARIELASAQTQWLSVGFDIGIENSANAGPYSAQARPSGRALTARRVSHVSNTQWLQNAWYALGEVGPLLQDVVNRPDWTASSPAAFVMRGTSGTWGRKFAHSADGSPERAPRLVVTYTAGAPSPPSLPTVSINDVAVTEGDTGTVTAAFTVSLSAPSTQQVTVVAATADGTATAGSDYVALPPTLVTFAAGTTSQPVFVTINGDTLPEANETFTVNLSHPVNATIGDGTAVGTITNDDGVPLLAIDDVTITEGAAPSAVFTATLTPASSQQVTVSYATANGTATAGPDYTETSGTLTFTPGAITRTISVPIANDALNEPDETFVVNLSGAVNASIADAQGQGTIVNDDPLPALSISSPTVNEGHVGTTPMTFTVSLSPASGQQVTVAYASAGLTAASGVDFALASGTLTFVPGDTSKTITVLVNGDLLDEADETLSVTLSSPTNATIATATGTGTIVDDDPTPTLSINDVSLNEGHAGTSPATFTVTLSAASGRTVTVDYQTIDGTSQAGTDFAAASGTLTFAPGAVTQQVIVNVTGDTQAEPDETFAVTLGNASNATIADGTGLGTIVNDDGVATISISDVTVTEGTGSAVPAVFTVSLSQSSALTTTVGYTVAGVTATSGLDFTAVTPGTLTFAPGVTSQSITVSVIGDSLDENDETFTVTLSSPTNATIADATGVGTIVDNDPPPAISIGNATVTEGNAGTVNAVFTVSLSAASGLPVSAVVATANGTAVAPGDYTAVAGATVNVPAGQTSATVTVQILGDTIVEANETFAVTLSAPVNATLGTATGTGTIVNDDLPAITIDDVSVAEGNAGTTAATFTVSLSQPHVVPVTVTYATANGTATAGSDYTAITATVLTFPPGTTSLPVVVTVIGDTASEPNETFFVNLSAATNATLADAQGVGTIINDDAGAVTVTVTLQVAAGGDDVNENDATLTANAADGWIGNANPSTPSYAGIRFVNVPIPAGATITSARLETQAASTQRERMAFQFGIEAVANSPAFTAASRPSQRTLLAPTVNHSSDTQWLANTWYQLDDIAVILQAAITQPGWQTGNALSLILRGTGQPRRRKFVRNFEAGATLAPRLVVTYQLAP